MHKFHILKTRRQILLAITIGAALALMTMTLIMLMLTQQAEVVGPSRPFTGVSFSSPVSPTPSISPTPIPTITTKEPSALSGADALKKPTLVVFPTITPTQTPTPQSANEEWRAPFQRPGEFTYAMTSYVIRINGDTLLLRGASPHSDKQTEEIRILQDARIETTNDQGKEISFARKNIMVGMMLLYHKTESLGTPYLYTRYIWVYPRF